jgi:hypothetical protein
MDNIFETSHGSALRVHSDLQPLTAPMYIILRWSKWHGWRLMEDLDVSYATLEDAVASRDWLGLDFREDLEAYMDDHADALPYAILELHPERGVQQYAIVCTGAEQVEAWAYGADAERVAYRLGLIARAD